MEFTLYRIKVMRASQKDFFSSEVTAGASELLKSMIEEKPTSSSFGFLSTWHIGNVAQVDGTGLYFALGRTAKSTLPVLSEGTGDFVDEEYDSAPYTHVMVDFQREICAIAIRSALAPTTDAMAKQLERLLARSRTAREANVLVTVSPISEPDQLLKALSEAYAITSFTVHFTRPNPLDVNDEFLKPMERLAQETGAVNGQTTIRGKSLDPDPLVDLVRSAAATGDNAVARIKQQRGKKSVRRSLRGQSARVSEDDIASEEGRSKIFEKLRGKHRDIRGSEPPDSPYSP